MSAEEKFIRLGHIYGESYMSIWLVNDVNRGHPGCWASDGLYDILVFQLFELSFHPGTVV